MTARKSVVQTKLPDLRNEITGLVKIIAVALLSLSVASNGFGQDLQPLTLEVSAGIGTGRSPGEYRDNRTGLTADALVGVSFSSRWVIAADASMQGAAPYATICIPSSSGGCVPSWPQFFSAAAMVGYEETRGASYRVLIGPAYVSDESHAFGLRGRFDVGVPVFWRIGASASFRVTHVPDYRGDRFTLYALGFGLRLR